MRLAHLPAEKTPVVFGVHSDVAEHYKVPPDAYPPHATTLDYAVAATPRADSQFAGSLFTTSSALLRKCVKLSSASTGSTLITVPLLARFKMPSRFEHHTRVWLPRCDINFLKRAYPIWEGLAMTRRNPGGFLLSALFLVLPPSPAVLLGPPSASAEDQILPLKIKVGEKAPDFALPSADGTTVRLSDYAGHNVLIDFYRGYW